MKQEIGGSPQLSGVLVSFEGVDGSGKTTQTIRVQGELERMGYRVLRAPDNSDASGEKLDGQILSILRQEKDRFFRIGHPIAECLLLAGRAAYLDRTEMVPRLRDGYVVLADRDIDTFIAYGVPSLYKAHPDKEPQELMDWMIAIISIGRTHPDLTILFKPNLNQFLPRATVGVYGNDQKDNFEPEDKAFMEQVVVYYKWLRERFPHRIQVLESVDKNKQVVLEELLQVIVPFLESRNVPKNFR